MNRRALICLLAITALALPSAAVAAQHCMAAVPCPMASSMAAAGCHQAALESLDCCRGTSGETSQDAVHTAAHAVAADGACSAAPRARPTARRLASDSCEAPAGPLYTLFRALLI